MYDTYNNLPTLLKDADAYVFENDRMLYKQYFEIAEKFCAENNIIVGGKLARSLICSFELSKDMFMWDMYTQDPFKMAKMLADKLYKESNEATVGHNYIAVRTSIKRMELHININARTLFRVLAMQNYKKDTLIDLYIGTMVKSYFGNYISILGADVLIIDVYHDLYNLSKVGEWENLLETSKMMISYIEKVEKSGGDIADATEDEIDDPQDEFICFFQDKLEREGGAAQETKNAAHDKIMKKVLRWIKVVGAIIIGDYALYAYGAKSELHNGGRLQIISDINIEDIKQQLTVALAVDNGAITAIKHQVVLLKDWRLSKHTFQLRLAGMNDESIALFDLYNSTSYEPVPYWTFGGNVKYQNFKVANPFVILRFLFIELWIIKFLRRIKILSDNAVRARTQYLINDIKGMKTIVDGKIDESKHIDLFQTTNWTGTYIDEVTAKKELIFASRKIPIYYPSKKIILDEVK